MTLSAAIILCTRLLLLFVSAGFLLHAPSFWSDQLLSRLCTPFLFQPISFELRTSVFSSQHLPAPLPPFHQVSVAAVQHLTLCLH